MQILSNRTANYFAGDLQAIDSILNDGGGMARKEWLLRHEGALLI